MTFSPEPAYQHGQPSRTAILLINLGTPDAPTPKAVGRYLKAFLSDPRVVEIPRQAWLPILHGLILPLRARASAMKYALVWLREAHMSGSPLLVHTERQANALQRHMQKLGHDVTVVCAMRYGNPSIGSVMEVLRRQGTAQILMLPLYPQFSGTTTAAAFDELFRVLAGWRNQPELRLVKHFHGLPQRLLDLGDPYHCERLKTGRLLGEALGLQPGQYQATFQSRFGKAAWLQPYRAPTLKELGKVGTQRVDVYCPGFPADCIETLEEIAMEGRSEFRAAGGTDFHFIPCMNDPEPWIAGLVDIALQHLQGWPLGLPHPHEREAQRGRAQARGAEA